MNLSWIKRYGWPVVTVSIFGVLFFVAFSYLFYESRIITNSIIVSDIEHLDRIFKKIDKCCSIRGFSRQKNTIDFLNVGSFIGSEIGSMNLAQPEKWEGPYLQDNPAVQGKEYEIVQTGRGYFIVPGTGVRLNNGKVIGSDIVFNESTDIEAMTQQEGLLQFRGKPMAAKITLGGMSEGALIDALVPNV
jgi:hypothetical protein